METNATRMCALLVAMADVVVLAVDDQRREAICLHVEQRVERPVCAECGTAAWVKPGWPGRPRANSSPCSSAVW